MTTETTTTAPAAPTETTTTVAAPAPAPAVAPVALTIEAPAVEAPPAESAVAYEATGDAALDLALEFVGNLGFGPEHAAIKAAEGGDFTALKAALKALGDKAKGFEKYVALAEGSVTTRKTAATERLAKETAMVHDVVGGEQRWGEIAAWARENAEPAEREQVNAALKAGGIAAKAMASYLSGLYGKASGTTVQPAAAVKPSASPAAAVSGPVTSKEFAAQTATLRKTLGPSFEASPQYQQLAQRRVNSARAGVA